MIRDILISAMGGLVPLLRSMLWLKNIERPKQAEQVLKKAADEFSIKIDSLIEASKWRHQKVRLQQSQIATAFESIYAAVEELAQIVDKLEV